MTIKEKRNRWIFDESNNLSYSNYSTFEYLRKFNINNKFKYFSNEFLVV